MVSDLGIKTCLEGVSLVVERLFVQYPQFSPVVDKQRVHHLSSIPLPTCASLAFGHLSRQGG
jgi:hypothetical protein